jgi:general secretion pathway protein K
MKTHSERRGATVCGTTACSRARLRSEPRPLRSGCGSARGSALLTVLWLSAALSAIAFSIAVTVRGETERTSTDLDGLRCGYVASAAVQRAAMELLWSASTDKSYIPKGATHVDYQFPSGNARVIIIPEASKLDVNKVPVEELARLIGVLGVTNAGQLAAAIDDWRRPGAAGAHSRDSGPSFQPQPASFGEIEELLLVPGVTPEIFYGAYTPGGSPGSAEGGSLIRHAGLIDCLSVYGSVAGVDVNAADPALLQALGVSPGDAQAIVQRRGQKPFDSGNLGEFGSGRLRAGGNTIVTFRATARLRLADGTLSDLRRTVAAQVKYFALGTAGLPYHVLRWYDTAWSD